MTEKKIAQQNCFELSTYQQTSKQCYQRKSYEKPTLQSLNTSADMIAGGSTSNQLENSNGLIGS